ncbi:hypothetical protein BDR26DRAFT_858628 [Obelidium mucronatum]|nr:hypothetical protein BDR26DRAFT_858628 [Obelidium mucronatum]
MGGNAIKNVQRLTTADHHRLTTRLIPLLKQRYRFVAVPRFLPTKTSHGDLDLLVSDEPNTPFGVNELKTVLNLPPETEGIMNGNMVSLNVEGFQVDVNVVRSLPTCACFHHPDDKVLKNHDQLVLEASVGFMDWGDLNRVLGFVAKRRGLVYSDVGLVAPILTSDIILEEASPQLISTTTKTATTTPTAALAAKTASLKVGQIILTHSTTQVLEYLKYPSQKWIEGFQNNTDLFEFMVSSPYFSHHDILNTLLKPKAGDKQRPMVVEFRDYLLDLNGGVAPTQDQIDAGKLDKHHEKLKALSAFGKMGVFKTMAAEYLETVRIDSAMKKAFSGEVIMSVIGHEEEGRNIGLVKAAVRKLLVAQLETGGHESDEWKKKVATMPKEDIEELIRKVWNDIRQTKD